MEPCGTQRTFDISLATIGSQYRPSGKRPRKPDEKVGSPQLRLKLRRKSIVIDRMEVCIGREDKIRHIDLQFA